MKLYFTETSPFVRKVLVCAHERGIADKLEREFLRPSPMKADPILSQTNPLSKIPALVLDDGTTLFDSSVICEYLDGIGDAPRLIPESGAARWQVLRLQALASGILDAGVLVFYERKFRPAAKQWEEWLEGQMQKVTQGVALLEREVANLTPTGPTHLGAIAAATACAWLEFREVMSLHEARPALAAWLDAFAERPSMQATVPR